MRGNEFLDKMELIDPAYVEAAEAKPQKKKTNWIKWGVMAACLCLFLTGAGFLAEFGMWATYDYDLASSNETLNKYCNGLEFPAQLGDYSFDSLQSLFVVPHGVSFEQALLDATYRPLTLTYRNEELDVNGNPISQRTLSINIGKTDAKYWPAYFSFDPETLEFIPDGNVMNLRIMEFQKHTVYLYDRNVPNVENVFHDAVWLESECGLCVGLSLYGAEGAQPMNITAYVEMVHDLFASIS